jgi:hypothetical protein
VFFSKFHALHTSLVDVLEYSPLGGFQTLAVDDEASLTALTRTIDRAGGFVFVGAASATSTSAPPASRPGPADPARPRDVRESILADDRLERAAARLHAEARMLGSE